MTSFHVQIDMGRQDSKRKFPLPPPRATEFMAILLQEIRPRLPHTFGMYTTEIYRPSVQRRLGLSKTLGRNSQSNGPSGFQLCIIYTDLTLFSCLTVIIHLILLETHSWLVPPSRDSVRVAKTEELQIYRA